MRSREILHRVLHDPRYSLADAEVWYVDRGAPGDVSRALGSEIVSIGPFAFRLATATGTKEIPHHRIVRILHRGEVLWERGAKGQGS